MKNYKKKHIERQTIWNNVQFIPEKKDVWYRGMHKGEASHSDIKTNNRLISISYFTYGDILNDEPLKDGWDATIYSEDGSDMIAYRDLNTDDHIIAENVEDAEKQALEWAETIKDIKWK
jgi:hypothetical protein